MVSRTHGFSWELGGTYLDQLRSGGGARDRVTVLLETLDVKLDRLLYQIEHLSSAGGRSNTPGEVGDIGSESRLPFLDHYQVLHRDYSF